MVSILIVCGTTLLASHRPVKLHDLYVYHRLCNVGLSIFPYRNIFHTPILYSDHHNTDTAQVS